jgi:predicted transcriptional regulator
MRTTVKIDDALLARAKTAAARSGRSLNAIVEDALRRSLDCRQGTTPTKRIALPTFASKRLAAGVDLDDTGALLDLMDGLDR